MLVPLLSLYAAISYANVDAVVKVVDNYNINVRIHVLAATNAAAAVVIVVTRSSLTAKMDHLMKITHLLLLKQRILLYLRHVDGKRPTYNSITNHTLAMDSST